MAQDIPVIIFLMGPTASGKTSLAIAISQCLPCDIISVDSGMIYRGMDIGTAKPTREELMMAPHRLIDILDPKESYSAGQFRLDALKEIEKSIAQNRIPLLVGGTMLYFHTLQYGIAHLPQADIGVRQKIATQAQEAGWEYLHRQLMQIDPETASRLSKNDGQRIQRALEVFALTGKTISELHKTQAMPALPYRVLNIALGVADKSTLEQRIKTRLQHMWQQGFIEEVELLYKRGDLHVDLPSVRTVGYRQVWECLAGTLAYEELFERVAIATRQLAKRQMTWLRKWQDLSWLDSQDNNLTHKAVNFIMSKSN